jgi:ATP-dependent Clp protease ATP-binding subunit ClpB
MFRPLTIEHMKGILEIQFEKLGRLLEKQDIYLEMSEDLGNFLIKEGFDLQFGARPLKRLIQKKIMDQLSMALLDGRIKPGMKVRMGVDDRNILIEGEPIEEKEASI